MKASPLGKFYDELMVGEEINHELSKTIFESDNNLFSLITMNHHPVHLNRDYADRKPHGKILVVGTLVLSLVVGLTVPDISGKALANLQYSEIKHLGPVFINDTIYARTKILSKTLSRSNTNRGIVKVQTIAYNQKGEDVLSLKRTVLIPVKE